MTRNEPRPFWLAEAVEKIHLASDAALLRSAMTESFSLLGYDHFIIGIDARSRDELGNVPTLTSLPDHIVKHYIAENFAECSPALAYIWSGDEPYQWSGGNYRTFYGSAFERRYTDYYRSIPVLSGIAIPLSRASGRVSAITVTAHADIEHGPDAPRRVAAIAKVAMMKAALLGISRDDSQAALLDADLSTRQVEILQWAARGKSNTDIAVITGQSKRAVDYHVSEILRKLKVSSRAQAVALTATARLMKSA